MGRAPEGGWQRCWREEGEERGILDASAFPPKLCLFWVGNCAHCWGGREATSGDSLCLFSALKKWRGFSHKR